MDFYLIFLILGFQVILTVTAIYVFYKMYNNIVLTEKRIIQREHKLKELYNLSTQLINNYNGLYEKLILDLRQNISAKNEQQRELNQSNDTKYTQSKRVDPNGTSTRDINKIMKMAKKGYDISQIAKASGVGKGEVKLILDLNTKTAEKIKGIK